MIKDLIDLLPDAKKTFAENIYISVRTLGNRFEYPSNWTVGELQRMALYLDIPIEILVGVVEGRKKSFEAAKKIIITKKTL